ncbi:hypothetical protein CEXT_440291 [Caerostris extrusa]|uniref:Uncharacterized protein n=1 Tax=Caerostris extrusa TaxID=172846 RepID=A0AAV4PUC3_CAEEX|nr:hypothetical protein CEXT_440291 [Caerostris extrusa]
MPKVDPPPLEHCSKVLRRGNHQNSNKLPNGVIWVSCIDSKRALVGLRPGEISERDCAKSKYGEGLVWDTKFVARNAVVLTVSYWLVNIEKNFQEYSCRNLSLEAICFHPIVRLYPTYLYHERLNGE